MHVATFFSFKGGVGRTMALVNVAVQLAQTGRRVLVVDFDLEAPGLDTFNLPAPREPAKGVVEYVSAYLSNGIAPDVSEYIYESPGIGAKGGSLSIMPAGRPDATYHSRLASIDWARLYLESDGYLLFEDLKVQWKERVSPDYVLIDSRTGYSEVGGICTRQLPDAVVLLFSPNLQNLRGLQKVVREIRDEAKGPRNKQIALHFVMSNVPDLDDEERILAGLMNSFQRGLGYDRLDHIVHRYDSLALLNQAIFTLERPNSRLAREYRDIANTIAEDNAEDRDSALRFLRRLTQRPAAIRRRISRQTLEDRLAAIRRSHSKDSEVLAALALLRKEEGRIEEALALYDDVIASNFRSPEVLLGRAECNHLQGNTENVISDLRILLTDAAPEEFQVLRAANLWRAADPSALGAFDSFPAVVELKPESQAWLAKELAWTAEGLPAAKRILQSILKGSGLSEDLRATATNELGLCLIALRDFEAARSIFAGMQSASEGIASAFNRAIADWGVTGKASRELFLRVVDLDFKKARPAADPNYLQCLSLAHLVVGDREEARSRALQARQLMLSEPQPVFSCWRYLTVPPDRFLEDMNELLAAIEGAPLRLAVFEDRAAPKPRPA